MQQWWPGLERCYTCTSQLCRWEAKSAFKYDQISSYQIWSFIFGWLVRIKEIHPRSSVGTTWRSLSCCVHNNSGNGIVTDLTESFRLVSSGQGRVPATSRTVRSVSCHCTDTCWQISRNMFTACLRRAKFLSQACHFVTLSEVQSHFVAKWTCETWGQITIIYHDSKFVIASCLQVTQNFDRRRWFFQATPTKWEHLDSWSLKFQRRTGPQHPWCDRPGKTSCLCPIARREKWRIFGQITTMTYHDYKRIMTYHLTLLWSFNCMTGKGQTHYCRSEDCVHSWEVNLWSCELSQSNISSDRRHCRWKTSWYSLHVNFFCRQIKWQLDW